MEAKLQKRQTEKWKQEYLLPFLDRIKKGMDISTYDQCFLAKQEKKYGVKMTQEDREYRDDQMFGPRKMYCQSFADRRWIATVKRRRLEAEALAKAKEKEDKEMELMTKKVSVPHF